jgi:hypothetical protein
MWIPVPGYAGGYEVDETGRVRSVDRTVDCWMGKRRHAGRVLFPRIGSTGYKIVTLSMMGRTTTASVHRLVARAFHGPPPSPRHQVDHKNKNKLDNRPINIRWVTPKENCANRVMPAGTSVGTSVLGEADVHRLRAMYDSEVGTTNQIATLFGVSRRTVCLIGLRKAWTHLPNQTHPTWTGRRRRGQSQRSSSKP